jgi:hypothetical protein
MDWAEQGVIIGRFVVLGAMFLAALLLGSMWCSRVCPAAMRKPIRELPSVRRNLDHGAGRGRWLHCGTQVG